MPVNHVYAKLFCPRCGQELEAEIESEIDGRGFAKDYRVGDIVDWLPGRQDKSDSLTTDGYVVCSHCNNDYFVRVIVDRNVMVTIEVDTDRKGYIK